MAEEKLVGKTTNPAQKEMVSKRAYLDIQGYGNSKIETITALAISEKLTKEQFKQLKKQVKKMYKTYNSLDVSSTKYQDFLSRLYEWAFNNEMFDTYSLGTISEFHSLKLTKMLKKLRALLNSYYNCSNSKQNYLLIAPRKKEQNNFKTEVRGKNRARFKVYSYKNLMNKHFSKTRFFEPKKTDEFYFYWLAKQINIAYSKVLKYGILDSPDTITNPIVYSAYNAMIPVVLSINVNNVKVFNIDSEVAI